MRRISKKLLTASILILLTITNTYAIENRAGQWMALTNTGQFSKAKKVLYLTQIQNRLDSYQETFDLLIFRLALGYQTSQDTSLWLGYDFRPVFNEGRHRVEFQQVLWPQFTWNMLSTPRTKLNWRTRIELVDDHDQPGIAWRLRQRFQLEFTDGLHANVSPVFFDEIFLRLNHPSWVDRHTFNLNRFFIGLKLTPKNTYSWEVGYINQFVYKPPNSTLEHVFVVSLTL